MKLEDFRFSKISKNDAKGIHHLMINNADRFKLYFPKTLEQNLTLDLAEEFAKTKEKEFEAKEEFLFTIKNTDTNKVIGLVYIKDIVWDKYQGEYAYCMDKNFGGRGIMVKTIKELSDYAFSKLGFKVLQIKVHKTNTPSVKVAEKSNFKWQQILLKEYTPPNEAPIDMELYELYYEG